MCGRPVKMRESECGEQFLVTGKPVFAVIQIPGLEGYTTAFVERVHRCPRM